MHGISGKAIVKKLKEAFRRTIVTTRASAIEKPAGITVRAIQVIEGSKKSVGQFTVYSDPKETKTIISEIVNQWR